MLRRLVLPVYLPVVLVNGGTAMLVPLLPLYLVDEGLSEFDVGAVIAAAGVGGMLSQIWIGRVLERRTESSVMFASLLLMAVTVGPLGLVSTAVMLAGLRLVSGIGSAGWLLSRQTFLTRVVEPETRGRAMALFGGTTRFAFLVGPLLAGALADAFGFDVGFLVAGCAMAAGMVPLLVWHRADGALAPRVTRSPDDADVARPSLRDHRRPLAVAGLGQVLVIAVRQGRFVVLPLIGAAIGLSPAQVGGLVGIGAFADLLLFPVSGYLMDRFGRLTAIVPSFALMGVGLLVLAGTRSVEGVTVAAVIIGVGNGMGSGTMLTLSADLAPPESPSGFLAALGTIRDLGRIFGPLLVGIVADVAGLGPSAVVLGLLAFVAVAVIVFGVGETRDARVPDPTSV